MAKRLGHTQARRIKLKAMKMTKQTNYYTSAFKGWPKQAGAKPTEAMLATAHTFARPGKQALALAMMLRDSGVTGGQIVMACGAPQLNKMRDTVAKGLAKRVPISNDAAGHTVYKLALTAKGETKVKAAAEKPAADTVVKPAKARKPKPVATPEPAPVAATEQPQPEQPAAQA